MLFYCPPLPTSYHAANVLIHSLYAVTSGVGRLVAAQLSLAVAATTGSFHPPGGTCTQLAYSVALMNAIFP